MINSVTVTNYLGESLKMEMRFPEKSGFLIQDITGLGPSKANINSTELSTSDGSLYNSARVTSRNIVLSLKLLWNPTIETTRQKSYKYFPIKKRVRLLIETDNRTCETYGYVESNEPNIFSSQETTQISIICPDPYLYSTGEDGNNVTIFSGIESLFEFPFSNELDISTEDGEVFFVSPTTLIGPTTLMLMGATLLNQIEFGEVVLNQEQTIYYTGDAEIGVMIYIHALGDVTNLTIYNSGTRESMKIDTTRLTTMTGFGIIEGDDIIISTIKGNKYIKLLRSGIYSNILNCLDKDADWFQLTKGDNVFAFTADTGITSLQFRIENQTVYEGV